MKHGGRALAGCSYVALSLLLFCAPAQAISADTAENPYQGIIDRNVFGLKPPPPPVSADAEANKPPLPKITLTGITTILGNKRALMKTAALPGPPPKPGEPPKGEQSYILAEGQRDGELEVLEIDEKLGTVKVNQSGTIVSLNFEQNGLKAPGGPANPPGSPLPQPGFTANPAFNPGLRTFPNRAGLRLPTPGGLPTPNPAIPQPGAPVVPGSQPGALSSVPTPGGVPTPQVGQPALPPGFQNLTAEEQALILLQKQLEQNPSRNPLPQ